MKNVLKYGINSNILKTIAFIAMVIDHIGVYFFPFIPGGVYSICRIVGRMAMPIFAYLIVQGFFHTKNYKKYVVRLGVFAVITQLAITILMVINKVYVPEYVYAKYIYTRGNVLFSYVIGLILIKIIHEDILVKKWDYHKNMSLKIILILVVLVTTIFIPLDYGIEAVLMILLMYFVEKFRLYILINKSSYGANSLLLKLISDEKLKVIYTFLIGLVIFLIVLYFNKSWWTLLSILPVMLYNEERGKNSNILKYLFYIIFPLQHILLYALALVFMFT